MPHKDPKKAAEYWAAHRKKNREKAAQLTAKWRLENPGRNAENVRDWRAWNPEKVKATGAAYRTANKEKRRATQKAWRERTKYGQSEKRKSQSLSDGLRYHGLTVLQYQGMVAAQGGGCAICGSTQPRMRGAKRLYIDHCHTTDRVRGALCFRCNSLLGFADESPLTLRRAADYLERPNDRGIIRGEARRLLQSRKR